MTHVTLRRKDGGVLLEWTQTGQRPHRWEGFRTAAEARAAYPGYHWQRPPTGSPRRLLAVGWVETGKEDE